MTIHLQTPAALSEFLRYVAEGIDKGWIRGVSVEWRGSTARASVEFAAGPRVPLPAGIDPYETTPPDHGEGFLQAAREFDQDIATQVDPPDEE